VRPRMLTLAPALLLLTGFLAQAASAQGGPRWRARQARREVAQQARANRGAGSRNGEQPNANGVARKGQPNLRAMAGLPPKWLDRMRDMSPEEQERFLRNNQRFQALPPERQEQIRRNLQKWNRLSPEERNAIRDRERILEQMSPEQRRYVRSSLLPRWQQLPVERRQAIRGRLRVLQGMTPSEREAALNDPRFMQGLSPDEQSLLRDLNSLRNPPAK
jgi:Protein of unknown function (DUF3106)